MAEQDFPVKGTEGHTPEAQPNLVHFAPKILIFKELKTACTSKIKQALIRKDFKFLSLFFVPRDHEHAAEFL